jgi:hypothetical protein
MDNKTKILIAFPVVLVIILMVIADHIPFVKDFSSAEKQVLNFKPADLKIKEERMAPLNGDIKSPMDFVYAETVRRPAPKKAVQVPQKDYNDRSVSLIVISGGRKMAIIEGRLVKEGDRVDGMKIAAIEPGRVLLENETSQWLYMKK